MVEDSYTNRMFNSSINEIRELHGSGMTVSEIALKVDLSEYLVKALVDRFVMRWDHYSGLPSPKAYEE